MTIKTTKSQNMMKFKNLHRNSTFVAPDDKKTYVKRENGVCPLLEDKNLPENKKTFGIFWPEDFVVPVYVNRK